MNKTKLILSILILILFCLAVSNRLLAGKKHPSEDPNSPPGLKSENNDEISLSEADIGKKALFQEKSDAIFTKYVDNKGLVDYATLRKKRIELIDTIREFAELHPAREMSWSDDEKIAFWINVHNIYTLRLIIDNYPIKPKWFNIIYPDSSIMQIPGGRNKKFFRIMTMEYTLQEIERGILMEKFRDPRVLFTLSYASMSGAYLLNEAYSAKKLESQLEKQTSRFFNSSRGIRIDKANNIVYLTDIFNWHKELFIEKYGSIKKFRKREMHIRSYLNFLIKYLPDDQVRYLESGDYTVQFQRYDWRLNEQIK